MHRCLGAHLPASTAWRCGLAGALVFALAFLWPASGLVAAAKPVLAAALYAAALLALGEVGARDLQVLRRVLGRR